MQKHMLFLVGVAGILSVTGCHKKTPLASKPTPPLATATRTTPATPAATPARSATRTPATPPTPARSAAMTAQERETLNQRLSHLSDALFDYDKASVRPDAISALTGDVKVIRGILDSYPAQTLTIEGGADERGSAEYNLALGDRRAHAAEEFLVTTGIPNRQLKVLSYGKDHAVCEEHNESCWQRNRRAHITATP